MITPPSGTYYVPHGGMVFRPSGRCYCRNIVGLLFTKVTRTSGLFLSFSAVNVKGHIRWCQNPQTSGGRGEGAVVGVV